MIIVDKFRELADYVLELYQKMNASQQREIALQLQIAHLKEQNSIYQQEMTCLKDQIDKLTPPELPTGYPQIEIPFLDMKAELELLGIKSMVKEGYTDDLMARYTDRASWERIIPYLVIPADKYVAQFADCEDYAREARSRAAMDFNLNGCVEAWCKLSWSTGAHACLMVKSNMMQWYLFEPNAGYPWSGELFKNGQYGYEVKAWR